MGKERHIAWFKDGVLRAARSFWNYSDSLISIIHFFIDASANFVWSGALLELPPPPPPPQKTSLFPVINSILSAKRSFEARAGTNFGTSMVLTINGRSDYDVHTQSELGNLIWSRHLCWTKEVAYLKSIFKNTSFPSHVRKRLFGAFRSTPPPHLWDYFFHLTNKVE